MRDGLARARAERAAIAAQVRIAVDAGAAHRHADDATEIDGWLDELALGFRGWAHRAVTAALPTILGAVFTPRGARRDALDERLELGGAVAALVAPDPRTLILAPTHASNLDAIVVGLTLQRLGLPPCAYPVGEHLFRNPVIAALIRSQGGFRIDRARSRRRYLAVLTAYLAALIERGVPLVVFPAGTRNRAGTVDTRLRLGLIAAAARVAAARGPGARVVPIAINHQIVLEGRHLVEYHLAGRGHERVVGDELFVPGRLGATARRLRALDQRVALHVGAAIERVDASALVAAYRRGSIYFDTQVVGRALDELRGPDAPALTAAPRAHPRDAVLHAVAAAAAHLDAHPADGRRWRAHRSAAAILDGALAAWRAGHPAPVATATASTVTAHDPALLWFYANRTRHSGADPSDG